jgi:hypothetical protein
MNKGFVILAQNTISTNYVECAEALAYSIKTVMPNVSVTLISNEHVTSTVFDNIVSLPHGDTVPNSEWKLSNDWQVYEASPYEYTIKLEADMYIPANIEYWFDILKDRDINVSSTIRDYKNQQSNVRVYRQFIDDNKLPDVYNAITYFRKSDIAKQFFSIVRDVFENWDKYKEIFVCNADETATTDWAYSIACHILGVENTTMPRFTEFSMIHMKQYINNLMTEDWTNELVYEFTKPLRIHTFTPNYPVHYHIKSFGKKLKDNYDRNASLL